jgi:peptidoglycan hydrolase-like protein with peptidoglycan-binding domain
LKVSVFTVVALALLAVLAGCGSGSSHSATSTRRQAERTKAPTKHPHTPAPRSATDSVIKGQHGPVLGWVRRLQRDLTRLGFYSAPITGRDSQAVKEAIVRFQRATHLKPDGLWGPKSQAVLDRMLQRAPSKLPPALAWIRNLQRDLKKLHLYSGPVTGVQTPATTAAIIRFQRVAHLKPDGLWGARSQAALDKMLHRS